MVKKLYSKVRRKVGLRFTKAYVGDFGTLLLTKRNSQEGGSMVLFEGANGMGKTLLLKSIARAHSQVILCTNEHCESSTFDLLQQLFV